MATGSNYWLLKDTTADVTAEFFFDEARKIDEATCIIAHDDDDVKRTADLKVKKE